MKTWLKITIILLFFTSNTQAHMLWVNSLESFFHLPGHAAISLGWGHNLPIDDFTNNVNAKATIERFALISPNGNKTPLKLPETDIAKAFVSTEDFDLFEADVASQKIAFKEDASKGVYLIEAYTKNNISTMYIDSKGRKRLALKPMDKIKDAQRVLWSVKHQSFAKSYLTIEEWSPQKPIGHGLEITPLTDLSSVKVGDMVEFDIRFNGNPLSYGPNGIEYITAFGSSFGMHKKFALFSYIDGGKAQFEIQRSGQWLVNVFHSEPVTEDGPLKELYNKTTRVGYGATLTFTVR